jgi:hypothetical protein
VPAAQVPIPSTLATNVGEKSRGGLNNVSAGASAAGVGGVGGGGGGGGGGDTANEFPVAVSPLLAAPTPGTLSQPLSQQQQQPSLQPPLAVSPLFPASSEKGRGF